MKKLKIVSIPFLTLIFVLFPMLTPDETGSMGVLVWGGLLVLSILLKASNSSKLPEWSIFPILMWLFGVLVSLISPYAELGNDVLKYLAFIILLILLTNYRYNWHNFITAFKLYALVSFVLSVLIILSFLTGHVHVDSIYEGSIRYSIGITGIYKNPNYIASFICQCFLVVLYLLFFRKYGYIIRIILASFAIVMTVAVFLTGTRAAIITVVMIVLLLILHYGHSKKNLLLKTLPYFIILTIVLLYYDKITDFVDTFGAARGGFTEDTRTDSWIYALNKASDSLLFGYGINSWNKLQQSGMLPGLHNIFIEFFLNQGLIGVVLLIITMFYGWNGIKKRDRFMVFTFCFINLFPLLFQNGLIDITFWRVLVMNRIVVDYSAYSENGFALQLKK